MTWWAKFGTYATIFRTRAIAAEWTTEYMPTPEERNQAREDEFVKKRIFIAMDERSKLMTEWKTLKPKLGSYLIGALAEASVTAIQEKHRIAWTKVVQDHCSYDEDLCAMRDCDRQDKQLCGCATSKEEVLEFEDWIIRVNCIVQPTIVPS